MKHKNYFTLILLVLLSAICPAQNYRVSDQYLVINASASDPLYTTYAAAMQRSRLYGDKAYKMDYYSDCLPVNYSSDNAGSMFSIWKVNKVVVDKIGEYHQKPAVIASFPDLVLLKYKPFQGIEVNEIFLVYSSKIAVVDMQIKNVSTDTMNLEVYPILKIPDDSLRIESYDSESNGYVLYHYETKNRLISNLYKDYPYPTNITDFFTGNFTPYSYAGYNGDIASFYEQIKMNDSLNVLTSGKVDFVSLHAKFVLAPGEEKDIRYIRGEQGVNENLPEMINEIDKLKTENLQKYIDADVKLFSSIPRIKFKTKAEKIVYLGAFNLVRGCMLPPFEKAKYNYYIFSRNPIWGWGNGHQVLHESLSMIPYAYLDAKSAENSQRIYMDQQSKDGLIAYRHGPRGPQAYPHEGKPTTSAPFFSWENWEIYKVSHDKEFLKEAYLSGSKYVDWLEKNRDTDHDGLFEWGPYGLIENVRDWFNVIFQVHKERYLDIPSEDISSQLEDLDLSLMVVNEMKSLAKMADALGKENEKIEWQKKANHISDLINKIMWDPETGFYYHVDKVHHSFEYNGKSLKRQEIIGFLALWAGVAPKDRAEILIKKLLDPKKFWRKYGIPTLAADDPGYSPFVDQCCKWNGPVWLLWDYMVVRGLREYGYNKIADEVSDKMLLAVTTQLSKNHNFWESFSPDNDVLNSPPNYIWDSIMAKVLIDKYQNTK